MKVCQSILRHVVVQNPVCNDGIKKLYRRIDPSCHTRIDDPVNPKRIDEHLRGNRGVDLADAAVCRCYFQAAGRSGIKFQICLLFLNSVGVHPTCFLKQAEKYPISEKPQAIAIFPISIPVSVISFCA